jgi:hypothetical protein
VRPGKVAGVRREGSALQIGHRSGHRIGTDAVDRRTQRAIGPDEHRAGDEQLGDVDVQRGSWSTQGRRGEVAQDGSVVDDHHVAEVEPAVRDPGSMQACGLRPHVCEEVVVDAVDRRVLQRFDVRLPGDDQRVSVGTEGRGHHLRDGGPGLRRH